MHLASYFAALLLLLGLAASMAHAQGAAPPTKDEAEVVAPIWKVGQWWRIQKVNTLGQPPRTYLRRIAEARQDGYIVEIVDETAGTTRVSLVSKDINGISNAVEGYPRPQMVIETRPDNGMFQFPIKVGSRWERSYLLINDQNTKLPTVIRGEVNRIVDFDTPLGRFKTYQINLWWKSEGAVPYQATCMYLPDIGWCAEYRSGLETSRVIEVGVGKIEP